MKSRGRSEVEKRRSELSVNFPDAEALGVKAGELNMLIVDADAIKLRRLIDDDIESGCVSSGERNSTIMASMLSMI